jgi:hypothetical protein
MGVQVLPGAPDPAGEANKRVYLIMDKDKKYIDLQ